MALLQDNDARFKGIEKKIGMFVILAIVGILLTVLAIGVHRGVFTPKTPLHFITDSGQSLDAGMAVKLSGFKIGQVDKLELTEQAQVRVTLSVEDKYMPWVRTDSKARLMKENVIGANFIEITPGKEPARPLASGSPITFERERGLGQVVDELYAQVQPLIEDLKRVVRRADTLLAGLPATQQKLDTAIISATKNLDNLEKVTASDLPAITKRGRETLDGAKKVVDSVSRTWPIRGHIKEPQIEALPVDSYEAANPPKQK